MRSFAVALALTLPLAFLCTGCGDDDTPPAGDSGPDDGGPTDTGGERCTSDDDCDDGTYCNGLETCDLAAGRCEDGTAPSCDDSTACTADSCDEASSSCVHAAPDDD